MKNSIDNRHVLQIDFICTKQLSNEMHALTKIGQQQNDKIAVCIAYNKQALKKNLSLLKTEEIA